MNSATYKSAKIIRKLPLKPNNKLADNIKIISYMKKIAQ